MLSPVNFVPVLISVILLCGCAGQTRTETEYGKAVRNVVSKQQVAPRGPLRADEPQPSTDGRRMQNVIEVYQTSVGDPAAVVRSKELGSGAVQ